MEHAANKPSPEMRTLFSALLRFLDSRPDLATIIAPLKNRAAHDYAVTPLVPQPVPAMSLIDECASLANETSRELVQAILDVAPQMHWNVTYTEEQVGKDFTERFGWFDVIAPRGPFVSEGVRVMVGYWGDGLDYQTHWHDPAEVYVPIAGSALFWSETQGEQIAGIGDAVFNAPNVKHWTKMTQGPLLALAIWQGDDTNINPVITDRNSDRIFEVKETP